MYQAAIEAAELAGQDWVVLEDTASPGAPDGFCRVQMHIPTGVAILAAGEIDSNGRKVYRTESYFLNRKTGRELPCGSRKWNTGLFDSMEQLQAAVENAKQDIYSRFAGLIAVYRRQHLRPS